MIDINIINKTIQELEDADTTFLNCQNLATLYIVREYLTTCNTATEEELNDILPQYKIYCNVKREYQLNKASKEQMLSTMESLCIEIRQFLEILYTNTDTQEERALIKNAISAVK